MAFGGFSFLALFSVCSLHTISAESGYFWHVTDFHYDPTYWTSQLSCNDDVPHPGMYGDYWCDSNWNLVKDSIENMALTKSDVDFVIWTGDTVAHVDDANLTLEINLMTLQNITDELKRHFPPEVKFLPSLGNHDFYPADQADVKQDEMYNKTAALWEDWISNSTELLRFMNGGFYSLSLNNNIRLLSVNTNLYYQNNRITKGMADPAGQFAWMESVLENAREIGEKIVVTAHVTPGVKTPDLVSWMHKEHQKRYVEILTKYYDVIVASYYGHDHSDGFKIMQDINDDSKAVAQFVAPSVTPWRYRAGDVAGKPHNPGVRLVEYDRITGKHINYVQYYINLTDSNMNNKSDWSKLYDFKETYGVDDMSVASLRKIFSNMKDEDGGEEVAQFYCNYALVSKEEKMCTKKNQFEIVCGGIYYELDEAQKCVDKYLFGVSSVNRLDLACIVVIFVFTIARNLYY